MKKIILIISSFFYSITFADISESTKIFKCMQSLQPAMQKSSYQIPNRSVVTMFKESFNGQFARMGESAADQGVISSGALIVDRNSIRVCPFDWSYAEPVVFQIEDEAGKFTLQYSHPQTEAPGKLNYFVEKSRWAFVSDQTRGKVCKKVSEADKSRAEPLLKKLILSALKKDISLQGGENYKTPEFCSNIVGITSKDISDLTQISRQPAVIEKATESPEQINQ